MTDGRVMAESASSPAPRTDPLAVLDAELARGSAMRMLVCAPVATGKTTVLEAWSERRRARLGPGAVAWLTLDARDNDVGRLRSRLQGAVSGLDLSSDAVLVLDDGHTVDDPGAVAHLAGVVRSTPFHTIVAARRAPDLPWLEFAADGSLSFLGWEDLALDHGAVAEAFRQRGCDLSRDDLDLVLDVTGGWAGAVRSAALLFGADGYTRPTIAELRERPQLVSDYLVGETISALPDDLTKALRSTSVVEWFTRQQFVDSGSVKTDPSLYLCEQHGIPIRRKRIREELLYGWHPLVRLHVKAVLQEEFPDEYERLNVVAAHSLARSGRVRDAFAQLTPTAPDVDVDDLVYRYGPAAVFDGDGDAVLDTVGASHDHLSSVRLLCALAAVERNDANDARAQLCSITGELSPVARMLAAGVTIEAAVIAGRQLCDESILQLENDAGTGIAVVDCYAKIQLAVVRLLTGRHLESEDLLRESLVTAGDDGHPRLVLRILSRLAGISAFRGDLTVMGQRAERAVSYAVDHGLGRLIDAAQSAATVGLFLYCRGERFPDTGPLHALASEASVHIWSDGTRTPAVGGHADAMFALLRARSGPQSEESEADALHRSMTRLLGHFPQPGITDRYVPEVVAALLDGGRSSLAVDIVTIASSVFENSPDVTAAHAMIALTSGDNTAAERLAREVLDAQCPPKRALAVQGWVLVAVAAFRDYRTEQAVSSIRQALLLGEVEGVVRPFLNYTRDTAELLCEVQPGEGVTRQFLDRVRGKLTEVTGERNPGLTRTEKTVLEKLRTGKVLRLIAEDMHLSVNTVRTHARNVYRKLDVPGREEAVEEAIRRGLL